MLHFDEMMMSTLY